MAKCDEFLLRTSTQCTINKSENEIVVSYKKEDLYFKWLFRRDSDCAFYYEKNTTMTEPDGKSIKTLVDRYSYDFGSFYKAEITDSKFIPAQNSTSQLSVSLVGVKFIRDSSYESPAPKADVDGKIGFYVNIKSSDLNSGKERYEAAIKYFKTQFCSGSAF